MGHAQYVTRPTRPAPVLRTVTAAAEMLEPRIVESIYAAAAALAPLSEPPAVAKMFAGHYAEARNYPGAVMAIASLSGEPVGFAYGHSWTWTAATDPWSVELRQQLGPAAAPIDDSFALELMAVSPEAQGAGLGRRMLSAVLDASSHSTAWLQTTDIDSAARRLYLSSGWKPLGHGPNAPDGRPGLVMIYQQQAAGADIGD